MNKLTLFGLFGVSFLLLFALGVFTLDQDGGADEPRSFVDFEERSYPHVTRVLFVDTASANGVSEVVETTETVTEVVEGDKTTRTTERKTVHTFYGESGENKDIVTEEPVVEPGMVKPILQRTDSGQAVAELQAFLVAAGAEIAVDGQFGDETRGAVMDYQEQHGLTVDGFVGQQTWSHMMGEDVTVYHPVTGGVFCGD